MCLRRCSTDRVRPEQLLGLSVSAAAVQKTLPFALEHSFDLMLLDQTTGVGQPWVELSSPIDLTVMRDAVRGLQAMNMEEEIALVNFGGLRSGTDVAKAPGIQLPRVPYSAWPWELLWGQTSRPTCWYLPMT